MEQEISSIEKRFAYGFLQKLLKWMEIAQEFIAHLGKPPLLVSKALQMLSIKLFLIHILYVCLLL